jgi:hypothetical protein
MPHRKPPAPRQSLGNLRGVMGSDLAVLGGRRATPDLVERHSTTADGHTVGAYGSEGWGFDSLRAHHS